MEFLESFVDWVRNKNHPEVAPQTDAAEIHLKHIGLMVLSTSVRKRYWLGYAGGALYPNLWTVLIGRSTFFHKSTGIKLGLEVLEKVDSGTNFKFPNEFSLEELVATLSRQPEGIFVPDEFSTFYTLFARNYMQGGISFLTEMYDRYTSYTRRLRSGEEFFIVNPFINILSSTTIEGLEQDLNPRDLRNGFLARFNFVTAREKERLVELPGEGNFEEQLRLVEFLRDVNSRKGKLKFSTNAITCYKDYYNKVIKTYKLEMDQGASPFISRLLVNTLKFSILFHLNDSQVNSIDIIRDWAVEKAIGLTDVLIVNAINLIDSMAMTPYEEKRRKVLRTIEAYQQKTPEKDFVGITRSALLRKVKMHKREFDLIVDTLLEEKTIIKDKFITQGATKPTEFFYINKNIETADPGKEV